MSENNKTIGALDKLIETKASEQLDKDIYQYFNLIKEHPLFQGIKYEAVKNGQSTDGKTLYLEHLQEALDARNGLFARAIRTKLLGQYKDKKAEELLKNFEQLNNTLKDKTS